MFVRSLLWTHWPAWSVWHATCDMRHAICDTWPITEDVNHGQSTCSHQTSPATVKAALLYAWRIRIVVVHAKQLWDLANADRCEALIGQWQQCPARDYSSAQRKGQGKCCLSLNAHSSHAKDSAFVHLYVQIVLWKVEGTLKISTLNVLHSMMHVPCPVQRKSRTAFHTRRQPRNNCIVSSSAYSRRYWNRPFTVRYTLLKVVFLKMLSNMDEMKFPSFLTIPICSRNGH